MGKTFRREKTFDGRRKKENGKMGKGSKLNTHRDLPDLDLDKTSEFDPEDYPLDEEEAEHYYAKTLHPKE